MLGISRSLISCEIRLTAKYQGIAILSNQLKPITNIAHHVIAEYVNPRHDLPDHNLIQYAKVNRMLGSSSFTRKVICEVSLSENYKNMYSILTNLDNFHSLEAVDRVSETQLQVNENSN